MKVLKAEAMGLCFGVRDALALTRAQQDAHDITIHGELVHNEAVLAELDARGFHRSSEEARTVPATAAVLVTAHGISDRERLRLTSAGKHLIDTTCPLVRKVHRAAQELAAEQRFVIVIGKPGHVEVRGIVEDLQSHAIVASLADVCCFAQPRLGIVCQTTVPIQQALQLVDAIRAANPSADVAFVDTVCEPTKQRQSAVEKLLPSVDAMVVVGGRNSNNTKQLVRLCEAAGVRTLHVQNAQDLDRDWFASCSVVGLTAGTSTPDTTITAVEQTLLRWTERPAKDQEPES